MSIEQQLHELRLILFEFGYTGEGNAAEWLKNELTAPSILNVIKNNKDSASNDCFLAPNTNTSSYYEGKADAYQIVIDLMEKG